MLLHILLVFVAQCPPGYTCYPTQALSSGAIMLSAPQSYAIPSAQGYSVAAPETYAASPSGSCYSSSLGGTSSYSTGGYAMVPGSFQVPSRAYSSVVHGSPTFLPSRPLTIAPSFVYRPTFPPVYQAPPPVRSYSAAPRSRFAMDIDHRQHRFGGGMLGGLLGGGGIRGKQRTVRVRSDADVDFVRKPFGGVQVRTIRP